MKILKLYMMPLALLVTALSFSQGAKAETGLQGFNGMTKSISIIDKKKNVITLGGKAFSYDGNTKIVNYKNEVVTEEDMRKGDFVTVTLNTSQRYISKPVLSHIRIETDHGE